MNRRVRTLRVENNVLPLHLSILVAPLPNFSNLSSVEVSLTRIIDTYQSLPQRIIKIRYQTNQWIN